MRIVIATYGSRGDVEPVIALALHLRELGVDVRTCAPPDFAERLTDLDLPLTPLGWPIRALATGAIPGKARPTLLEITAELTAMAYRSVTAAAEGSDAIVATGSMPAVAGMQTAAERIGVPFTAVGFCPAYFPSPHHPPLEWPGAPRPPEASDNRTRWDLNAEHLNRLFGDAVNAHRTSVGLSPVANIRDHVLTDRPWLAADPTLAPWTRTPELDLVQTGAWTRPDHRPLPADLEAFLESGPPPVYIGFGSQPLRGADTGEISRAVVAAVRAHGRRTLLSRGWAELGQMDDQDDCLTVGESNHQALFERVAAVVHHGGAGTTTTAARTGTPQVIVPQAGDQPYWADRVADLGIGSAHNGPTPTAESLATALETALDTRISERAATLAAEVSTDGTETAARLLIEGNR